jgi:hypothetical protein
MNGEDTSASETLPQPMTDSLGVVGTVARFKPVHLAHIGMLEAIVTQYEKAAPKA